MKTKKKVIAISGSTRLNSTNLSYIKAITALAKDRFETAILDGIDLLPHFNPDLDNDNPPAAVISFRNSLKTADGILICTPEYAMGVPGSLKNAIDWTVTSMEFSHKPVALVTASSIGEKAHQSLLETLKIIESNINDETQLLISFAKTKINNACVIIDETTLQSIQKLIEAFALILDSYENSNT